MLLVKEPGNPELDHTASTLVGLGLAMVLDDAMDTDTVISAVALMEDETVQRRMREALSARPTGGHRQAAAFLAARMNGISTGEVNEGCPSW